MKHLLAIAVLSCGVLAVQLFAESAKSPAAGIHDIGLAEAEKLLKEKKEIVVLDIRTPKEFQAGRIAGAKNLDFYESDFEKKLSQLDRSKPYLLHCASGGRSAKARDLMKKLKFDSVYHFKGGFNAWRKAGKPIEK